MAAKSNGEPRYQVPRELADSLAFRSLPNAAKLLWHDLMMSYRGRNNGNINATMNDLKHYGWQSSATLAKALAYLIAHGFLRETRNGGGNGCSLRQCCLYAFTHLPVNADDAKGVRGSGATHDYRVFDPTKLPEKITLLSLKSLPENASRFTFRSVTLQKMKPHASENEVGDIPMLQKMKRENLPKIAKSRTSKRIEAY